jgi:transposase
MASENEITATSPIGQLPDDANTLKQMVLTLLGEIDDLNGQLYYLKRQLFGKKSEKLNPNQRMLFEQLYEETKAKVEEQRKPKARKTKKRKVKHNGRNPLPADLPRKTIEREPTEEEKICPVCNNQKSVIGTETTEVLEYIPASFFVKQYIRHKYGCKQCQNNISIGQLPPRAIDKGIAGEGLLAHIITSKYSDHLPLNRLEGIFKRNRVEITVSNMCDWVAKCADLLDPLVKRMHQKILQSPKINTDDSATS